MTTDDQQHEWVRDRDDLIGSDVFGDLNPKEDRTDAALLALWQKDIVEARWCPEDEVTAWRMTEFGVQQTESGELESFIKAMEPQERPNGVRTL